MKTCRITRLPTVESTDEYFLELYNKWLPVPNHWVGNLVQSFTFKIRAKA